MIRLVAAGWQVILVAEDAACSDPEHQAHSADDHGDPGAAFAYTVGLWHRFGHPELLMSGLDQRVMHSALNEIARRDTPDADPSPYAGRVSHPRETRRSDVPGASDRRAGGI